MPNDGRWMGAHGARFIGVGGRFVSAQKRPRFRAASPMTDLHFSPGDGRAFAGTI